MSMYYFDTCFCVSILILPYTTHYTTLYHIIPYHIISYHIIAYHIISYYIIAHHIIAYYVGLCCYFFKKNTDFGLWRNRSAAGLGCSLEARRAGCDEISSPWGYHEFHGDIMHIIYINIYIYYIYTPNYVCIYILYLYYIYIYIKGM